MKVNPHRLYSAAAAAREIGCSPKAVQKRLDAGFIVREIHEPQPWDHSSGAFRLTAAEVRTLAKEIHASRQYQSHHGQKIPVAPRRRTDAQPTRRGKNA